MERRASAATREGTRRRRRSSVSGFARRASIMGQAAALEVQKAEMEAKIAQELQTVTGQPAGRDRSSSSSGGGGSPYVSPTSAMDRATTPEQRLRAAAAWGHDEALVELLQDGAPAVELDAADTATHYRWTAFHLACINGQAQAVERLVRAGCDTARVIGVVEKTGAQYAQHLGQQAVVDVLRSLVAEGCGGNELARQLAQLAAGATADASGSGAGERRTGVSAESTSAMLRDCDETSAPAAAAAEGSSGNDGGQQRLASVKKTPEQLARISAAVGSNLLFSNQTEAARREVFDLLVEQRFEAGVDVVRQGDDGEFFYIIDEGELQVVKDGTKLTTLSAGDSFGELALMYTAPRAATVRTIKPTVCWSLDRVAFRTTLFGGHRDQIERAKEFLAGVPLLQPLSPQERHKVVDAMTAHRFAAGEEILVAGTFGEAMFILQSGTAVAVQPPTLEQEQEEELLTYSTPGDFFGELALLTRALS
jgi:CRP-like cAMP-binding protein